MIEVRDLVKTFNGFRALDGLNLTVPRGAVYGLVGPNGAGKSTAIRHLAGIYRQDGGSVRISGEDVFENPRVKARLAYIPDEIFFYPQATGMDLAGLYAGVIPTFSKENFSRLGALFEAELNRPMRKLSKGMQKQVAFCLALSSSPDVVILDEPVDGLDPVMRRQVWRLLLADVAERGTTVLVSSHNLRELEDVCDHVGIMNHGQMLLEHSVEDLQENIIKLQAVFPDDKLPALDGVLFHTAAGRLQQYVIRGSRKAIEAKLALCSPVYTEFIPLTLEEVFIYELGGAENEIRNILV